MQTEDPLSNLYSKWIGRFLQDIPESIRFDDDFIEHILSKYEICPCVEISSKFLEILSSIIRSDESRDDATFSRHLNDITDIVIFSHYHREEQYPEFTQHAIEAIVNHNFVSLGHLYVLLSNFEVDPRKAEFIITSKLRSHSSSDFLELLLVAISAKDEQLLRILDPFIANNTGFVESYSLPRSMAVDIGWSSH